MVGAVVGLLLALGLGTVTLRFRGVYFAIASLVLPLAAVNIIHVPGKVRRRGRSVGMTRSWKKAIVTLRAGQRLDLFEGV